MYTAGSRGDGAWGWWLGGPFLGVLALRVPLGISGSWKQDAEPQIGICFVPPEEPVLQEEP